MRYFPKIVFELDTGSRILESKFVSTDGTRGALNDPHKLFESAGSGDSSLFSYYLEDLRVICSMPRELPLLSCKEDLLSSDLEDNSVFCKDCACQSHCTNMCVLILRVR